MLYNALMRIETAKLLMVVAFSATVNRSVAFTISCGFSTLPSLSQVMVICWSTSSGFQSVVAMLRITEVLPVFLTFITLVTLSPGIIVPQFIDLSV